ncbi:MAG: HPr family phosphocarrier protein [Clostridia bacterium]|nr:HPr family phosphocarrier protein [Clostridia bacterium]
MEKSITVCMGETMTAKAASRIAMGIGSIDARILLRRGNMTVNAKSLMGLISLGLRDGDEVCAMAEGPQAQQAIDALARLLGA